MKNAPAYIKIYNRLKNEIQKGTYPVGGFLPKEYELEEIYQVSRTTIRNAVKILAKEGMVEVRQGRGTRVLDHKAIQNYNKVTSVTEALRKKVMK
ncbi:MAG: GntR family transcriptional regulator [Lachnospiraceae bacterium]